MVVEACIEASLELNNDLASVLSVWAIIFVACPYLVVRDIGLRLGRALSTLVDPEIVPNLCEFIETHERDFMARAIVKLVWLSSMAEPADLPTVSFHQSLRCSSWFLDDVIFTPMLYDLERYLRHFHQVAHLRLAHVSTLEVR
jgi:hypothetical protein